MARRNPTKGRGRHREGGELNEVTRGGGGAAEKRGDGLKSVSHWTDSVSTRNNGPAEDILERWEAVKFNRWNIFFTAS